LDELLGRSMPSSTEAEQAVVGSMIIDARCVPEVIELLKPEDFYIEQNQAIFGAIQSLFSLAQPIDPVTVLERMKLEGTYDQTSSRSYIMQLMEVTPTAANARRYAEIVRDKAMLRQIASAAGEISSMAFDEEGEASDVLEAAEQKIYAIRQGRSNQGFASIASVLIDVYDRLNELAANKGKIPGLTTGFAELDHITTGLNNTDLVLVASRPGMGKTSIALNIALSAAKKHKKAVAVFSLEMSKEQLAIRLLSGESFVDSRKLNTGDMEEGDWTKIAESSEVLSRLDIRIDDNPAITPAGIKAKCRRIENLGLIIVDYLQLMSMGGKHSENRVQEVSEISRAMKIMAKELNVPVLCLSQLSRANEKRTDKRPMLSDLRESGAIEQDADIILFLYREDYYDENTDRRNLAECIVAKNRRGSTGTVELQWVPQYTMFASRDKIHDDG